VTHAIYFIATDRACRRLQGGVHQLMRWRDSGRCLSYLVRATSLVRTEGYSVAYPLYHMGSPAGNRMKVQHRLPAPH